MGNKSKQKKIYTKFINSLSNRDKTILFICLLVFTFVIVEETFIRPLKNKEIILSEDISKLTKKSITITEQINNKDELEKELGDISISYNSVVKNFPKSEKQADIIRNLNKLSDKNGLNIQSINFENNDNLQAEVSDKDNELNLKNKIIVNNASIVIQGEYKNILLFMKEIENLKRKININSIQISSLEEKNESNQLEAMIGISYYNLDYKENENYDFNKGKYGKEDYFK